MKYHWAATGLRQVFLGIPTSVTLFQRLDNLCKVYLSFQPVPMLCLHSVRFDFSNALLTALTLGFLLEDFLSVRQIVHKQIALF